jgi:hypothetical protein
MVQRLDEVLSRSLEDAKYTVVRLGALAVYDTLLTTIGQQGMHVARTLASSCCAAGATC